MSASLSLASASSPSRAIDVIDLLEDDHPEALTATTAAASSNTSSSESVHFLVITPTSQHRFSSYKSLREFIEQFAAQRGFHIRYPGNRGIADTAGHSESARCWYYLEPPLVLKAEEQQQPSHPPLRTVVPRAANRSGNQVKCACPWRVNFSRHADGSYVITPNRCLEHAGHECVCPQELATTIDSLLVMPDSIVRDVRIAVRHGQRGMETLRQQIAERYQLSVDRRTFLDLVQRSKLELGIQDGQDDFDALVPWLMKEIGERGAFGRLDVDGALVSRIFYMSAEMIHHSRRNGQVLLMDTTFNTNRFGWPLCLLCGVDELRPALVAGKAGYTLTHPVKEVC